MEGTETEGCGHAPSFFMALCLCDTPEASRVVTNRRAGTPVLRIPIPVPLGGGNVWAVSSGVIHGRTRRTPQPLGISRNQAWE